MRAGGRAALLAVTVLCVVAVARFVAVPHDEAVRSSRVCSNCVTTTPPPTAVVAGPYGQWLVDAAGNVEAFGDARYAESVAAAVNPVVAIAATPSGHGYWTVSQSGAVRAAGDAHDFGDPSALASTGAIVAIAATSEGKGYWLATRDGAVLPFGSAAHFGDRDGATNPDPAVAL